MLFLIAPLFVYAQSYGLQDFIEHADTHNQLLASSKLKIQAKQKEVDAQESAFAPILNIGANYTNNSAYNVAMPGESMRGYVSLGMELYDGGRKRSLTNAKMYQQQASLFEKQAFEKSLTLKIINNFYSIKTSKSTLKALEASSKELRAQIDRVHQFWTVGMATQEDVDKLQATFDDNTYLIENTKLEILSSKESLWLNSGIETKSLKRNRLIEPQKIQFEPYEKTKIIQSNAQSLREQAKAIDSGYLPQIRVDDTYSKTDYNQVESIPGFGGDGFLIDEQNSLIVSANLRLFDGGRLKKEREALQYQKMSLDAETQHSEREQRMNFRVAGSRLQTIHAKLKSAKSGLHAARSTHEAIVKKFETGLVDNITYLDALQKRTRSEALYKSTQYNYEIAKSIYYFYAGKNPREYIQ